MERKCRAAWHLHGDNRLQMTARIDGPADVLFCESSSRIGGRIVRG
jgi:hypothetical protein